ncbi:hypothetical protein RDI58_022439 [Solanum bulbocastanum]|uniref:Uncharacterized protein n=1 Tax=Solanum bulbocastanum TaxID=147425 RepID=A0AAN8T426_SOLBU
MSLPPPPFLHPARSVRRKEDERGENTNQQLLAPSPPSYHANSVKGINDGRGVHTTIRYHHHKHIVLPYLEKMLMAEVYKQTSTYYHHHHPHIVPTQLEVTTMAESHDPFELKFEPQLVCDNETSVLDLTLKL